MKKLLFAFFFFPFFSMAQGIKFEEGLTWEQVKQKAKAENKYIFVDAYATWCVPCKKMDKDIYVNETAGLYVQDKFISVKVQVDSTKQDSKEVQQWYATADSLAKKYNIIALPTFLFFSPDGEAVHKDIGGKALHEFFSMLADAVNPDKQYYLLIDKFKHDKIDISLIPTLATNAKNLDEKELANQIASTYIHDYLEKQTEFDFLRKDNLNFILGFSNIIKSGDSIFKIAYNTPDKYNAAVGDNNAAKRLIDYVIYNEEVHPFVEKAYDANSNDLDWETIQVNIISKYNKKISDEIILDSKVNWYKYKKNWNSYCQYLIRQIDNVKDKSSLGWFQLNNSAYGIFKYSNNRTYLKKALSWIDIAIAVDTTTHLAALMYDTKAGILYNLGRKKEAIALQEKAIAIRPEIERFKEVLIKMKKGEQLITAK